MCVCVYFVKDLCLMLSLLIIGKSNLYMLYPAAIGAEN